MGLLLFILGGLTGVTVAAVVVGLWAIALVDALVVLIVAVGLRVAFPARRAVLTYREIMERQGRPVPMEPVPEQPVTAEQPVEQPVKTNRSVTVEQTEELGPMPGALAAA